MTDSKSNSALAIYEAASKGDLQTCKDLHDTNQAYAANMALMGASSVMNDIRTKHGASEVEFKFLAQINQMEEKDGKEIDSKQWKSLWLSSEKILGGRIKSNPTDFEKYKKCMPVVEWAMEKGAYPLWGIQQSQLYTYQQKGYYNKSISMLRGPGEVSRGTFKKD